jgi:GNAT superfamily N-acetyltransferase
MNIHESTQEDKISIDNKLVEFNQENVPFQQKDAYMSLSFIMKDENSLVIGGINATLYCWNLMYIDVLYIEGLYRRKGYGKMLVAKAEAKARQNGGYMSHLDTFDWQAKEFYENIGYEVFGILDNCPRGHKRYFMKKNL